MEGSCVEGALRTSILERSLSARHSLGASRGDASVLRALCCGCSFKRILQRTGLTMERRSGLFKVPHLTKDGGGPGTGGRVRSSRLGEGKRSATPWACFLENS